MCLSHEKGKPLQPDDTYDQWWRQGIYVGQEASLLSPHFLFLFYFGGGAPFGSIQGLLLDLYSGIISGGLRRGGVTSYVVPGDQTQLTVCKASTRSAVLSLQHTAHILSS